jgi:integrase
LEPSTISRSGAPTVERNADWVDRFVSDVKSEKDFAGRESAWTPILTAYLKKNPYPPQNIFVQRLRDFVDSLPADTRTEGARCLYYFYAFVCKSREHCDVAQRIGREAAMVADGVAAENKNTGDSRDGPTAVAALTAARGKEPGTVNTAGKGAGAAASAENVPRMKTAKKLPRIYGRGDLSDMLEALRNPKHRLVLMVTYGLGLRVSELRSIKVEDIDWDRMVLRVHGKGSKERDLPIDESFEAELRKHLSDNPGQTYLFEGAKKGEQYALRTIQKIYENAFRKAKIRRKGGIHSLRHSYATHLFEQGVGIAQIQSLMGHANLKTTQIYAHVSQEQLSKIRSPLAPRLIEKGYKLPKVNTLENAIRY